MILWLDIIYSVFVGIIACLHFYYGYGLETGRIPTDHIRYRSPLLFYFMAIIIGTLTIILAVLLLLSGNSDLAHSTFNALFLPAINLTLFYPLLLLLLLPVLRKKLLSRSCTILWLLFPLLIFIHQIGISQFPLFVIRIPLPNGFSLKPFILPAFKIWMVGFVFLISWSILSHILYRHRILKTAQTLSDERIRNIMNKEAYYIRLQNDYFPVLSSELVNTPLSIGLFWNTTNIILPARDYDDEELAFIFRHELIHLSRRDALLKFVLFFFSALFWFNPLMWIARRQCANDIELSCDESVLYGYDADTHHRYANLLLKTAAEERGFTTCLSCRAKAMRYRLKNIISKKQKWIGGAVLSFFLAVFVFISLNCNIIFREETTLQNIIEKYGDPQSLSIVEVVKGDGTGSAHEIELSENTLERILHLPICDHPWSEGWGLYALQIDARDDQARYRIGIWDHYVYLYISDVGSQYYYMETPFDLSSVN